MTGFRISGQEGSKAKFFCIFCFLALLYFFVFPSQIKASDKNKIKVEMKLHNPDYERPFNCDAELKLINAKDQDFQRQISIPYILKPYLELYDIFDYFFNKDGDFLNLVPDTLEENDVIEKSVRIPRGEYKTIITLSPQSIAPNEIVKRKLRRFPWYKVSDTITLEDYIGLVLEPPQEDPLLEEFSECTLILDFKLGSSDLNLQVLEKNLNESDKGNPPVDVGYVHLFPTGLFYINSGTVSRYHPEDFYSSGIYQTTAKILVGNKRKLIIQSPHTNSENENDFLVRTREQGTIVEENNQIIFGAKVKPEPKDSPTIRWLIEGEGIKNREFQTESGKTKTINLTGPRQKSGRGEPISFKVTATTKVNGEELKKSKKVKQGKGDPYYSVIRQEYEDTKKIFGEKIGSEPHPQPSIDSLSFTSNDKSDLYNLKNAGSWDYGEEYGVFNEQMGNGIDNVTKNMREITYKDGKIRWPNLKFGVNSAYRNPAKNVSLRKAHGNSAHIYGIATDIDLSGLSSSQLEYLYDLLEDSANHFYGNGSPGQFKKRARSKGWTHIEW